MYLKKAYPVAPDDAQVHPYKKDRFKGEVTSINREINHPAVSHHLPGGLNQGKMAKTQTKRTIGALIMPTRACE
jgi:hypothetical protein